MMGYRAENILRLMKAAAPTAIGLAGVILLTLPLRLFEGAAPTPIIPLIVVFFWSIYGPDHLPSLSIFLIGLLQDLLTGGPLGLWAGVYLITQFIVMTQRSYFLGREPRVVWIGFAMAAAGASIVLWLVSSLLAGVLLPLTALAVQIGVTILFYPLFGLAFGAFHRRILEEA